MRAATHRIVYVTCFLDASGVSRLNFDLLKYLQQQGSEIHVVTTAPHNSHFTWEYLFRNQFRHVYDLSEYPSDQSLQRFLTWLSDWNASLLFNTHSEWLYRHASSVRKAMPEVAIVDALHTREPYVIRGGYPDLSSNPKISPALDSTIVISENLRNYISSNYDIDPRKLVLIRNGIDMANFDMVTNRESRFREELGLEKRRPLIGFIGRLSPQKRPLLFLDIAEGIARIREDVFFYMIGSGGFARSVEKRIRSSDTLRDRIARFGRRDDMSSVLQATDLLLVPSLYEGAPLTIMEALASGTAVVASDVGAIKEYFEDMIDLLPVTRNEADEFIAKSLAFLKGERRRSIPDTFRERFDASVMARQYRDVFDRVAGRMAKSEGATCDE